MKARRAQGWLDHEVIVGNLMEQYYIVGNGVDRNVSFVLGLALREAMSKNACMPVTHSSFENDGMEERLVGISSDEDEDGTSHQLLSELTARREVGRYRAREHDEGESDVHVSLVQRDLKRARLDDGNYNDGKRRHL